MKVFRSHQDNVGGCARIEFDVAEDGGMVGSIDTKMLLPAGALVKRVYVDTLEAVTSAGLATVAVSAEAPGDLLAATAIASLVGVIDGVPDASAANMVRTTEERNVMIDIAVDNLDAGKFNVYLEYLEA